MEPNDSLAMALLVKMGFSFPYELPAVIDHDYRSGGVRDSHIPNFLYRWNGHEVFKTVSSYIPERIFSVRAHPYWDFSVTEKDLDLRKETRIGSITSILGARNFISLLRFIQLFLNWIPGRARSRQQVLLLHREGRGTQALDGTRGRRKSFSTASLDTSSSVRTTQDLPQPISARPLPSAKTR